VTGFDIVDRYDMAATLLFGCVTIGALALGAPLWVAALIVLTLYIGIFVRHFDQLMRS
jgi:hypothetical protein